MILTLSLLYTQYSIVDGEMTRRVRRKMRTAGRKMITQPQFLKYIQQGAFSNPESTRRILLQEVRSREQ